MKCILLGGAESVGKSETIYRLANNLVSRGFVVTAGKIPQSFSDFRCVLEGLNQHQEKVRIIINSPTDTTEIIQKFEKFFNDNGGNFQILISSIRDNDFYPRNEFFQLMKINNPNNLILEIPLGKITRRGNNFNTALDWYQNSIDNLIKHVLSNSPFNI